LLVSEFPLEKVAVVRWEGKLLGQIKSGFRRRFPRSSSEKGFFTLVSGNLNDDPIFAGVAASTVSRVGSFVRAAAIELLGCVSMGESQRLLKEYELNCPVLHRHDSGSKDGEWTKPTNAQSWGRKPGSVYKG